MRLSVNVQRRFEKEEEILRALYDVMEVGKEEEMGARAFSEMSGRYAQGDVMRAVKHYVGIGLMENRLEYKGQGRTAYWKMIKPKGIALELLQKEHKRELLEGDWFSANRKPMPSLRRKNRATGQTPVDTERVALARENSAEQTRAIAGPEAESPFAALAPLRKNESAALVEAARQHANRSTLVATKLKELRDAGITVDEGAIKFERDERLETIALVLPYIDDLQGRDQRYENLARNFRDLEHRYNALRREHEALQRWRDARIREQVARGPVVTSNGAPTNGLAQSGASSAGAEDRDRSQRPAEGAAAGAVQPTVGDESARASQHRGEASATAGRVDQ